jgi:tetratricopeptide (TPR) repeat protein
VRPEVNYPILALAHQALGQTAEARQALDRAQGILDDWTRFRCQPGPDAWIESLGASGLWPVSSWDWMEFELYVREARGALGLDPTQQDPRFVLLRARSLAGLRRFEAADVEYTAALELLPDDPQVRLETHRNRAYYHAMRNEPALAAEQFAQASDLQPDDARLLGFEALMYLAADDVETYRGSCRELIARFGDSADGHVAHAIIDACVLHPQSLSDMGPLLNIGRQAAKNYLGGVRMLGAAHYRNGEFAQAVSCFEESASFRGLNSWDLAFLAMAHFRLGNVEAATRTLEDADRWLQAANRPMADDPTLDRPTWGGWYEKIQGPIVLGEARALIRPTAAPRTP